MGERMIAMSEALLGEIGDAVFRLDDLRGDLPALEVIFSAV